MIISFEKDPHNEEWMLFSDERHGKKGYRANRYLLGSEMAEEVRLQLATAHDLLKKLLNELINNSMEDADTFFWDEHHMFYESIDAAYAAFLSGNTMDGRLRF
jgi:Rad3-related DNA helicase